MKRILAVLLFSAAMYGQSPPISLTATVGSGGAFPVLYSKGVVFTSDGDHAMVYPEMAGVSLVVTSSVSLTATRNLIAPAGFYFFIVKNLTSGGQSIQLIGPSGAGVTIPNGAAYVVQGDGANYVNAGAAAGSGCIPTSGVNSILINGGSGTCLGNNSVFGFDPSTQTVTENFASYIPGFSFGNWGVGHSNNSTNTVSWQTGTPASYTQGLWSFWNMANLRKMSNDDLNVLNMNTEFDGACLALSDECYVPLRNQHSIAAGAFIGVVASHSSVTGGNSLTFSSSNGSYNFGPPRPVIDTTTDVQAITITSVSFPAGYALATVSGTPFSVSITGTASALIDVTPNSNNTPSSITTTLNVTGATALSVGQLLTFAGPFVETVKLTAVGSLSGGTQSVTYQARISHPAGTLFWCGGWSGRWTDFPGFEISSQKMMYRVLGTPANNQIAIAREIEGGTDGAFVVSGGWNVYHGGTLIDARDFGGVATGNALSVVSDNDAAWNTGDSAEVPNGMYSFYDFYKDTSAGNNNPYSMGSHFRVICNDNDPTCGDLIAQSHGSQAIFEMDNGNLLTRYSGHGGLWNIDNTFDFTGYWGAFAWYQHAPIGPLFSVDDTSAATNIFQANDRTAYFQFGPSGWFLSGDNITLGSGGGAASPTNLTLNGTLNLNGTLVGQATAPTGSCTTSQWSLTRDGKISFCKSGVWEVVITAP